MIGKIEDAIQSDGSLYDIRWYLSWNLNAEFATLDGLFTAQELRAIADHMDKLTQK